MKDAKKDAKQSISLTRFLQQSYTDKDLFPLCEQVITNLNVTPHVDTKNREIVFHGTIAAERTTADGAQRLVHWYPEGR